MTDLEISRGTVWKALGEYQWIVVDKVHGLQINGRLRAVPSLESDWIGSPASFENLKRTEWRTVNATCSGWDHQTCVRVLAEHWITYESVRGVKNAGASLQLLVASMGLEAISDKEAVQLVEGALGVAGAEWIQCRTRSSLGWGTAS
jgi:hypothetical protein